MLLLLFSSAILAQEKFYTKSGSILFEASVPSFEEVKARNNTVSSIFDVGSGEIAVLALIKGFRFKVALMEEHFNENYAESESYPKATFNGKIHNFFLNNLTKEPQSFESEGTVNFHGETIAINPKIYISVEDEMITLTSNFTLDPIDFGIEIPKILRKKVAETVDVAIHFKYIKKK